MPLGGAVALGAGSLIANMVGGKNASKAAKTAAQIQQDAVNKAQGIATGVYGDQKAALKPYQDFGQYGMNNFMKTYGNQTPQDFASRVSGFTNSARFGAPMPNQGLPQGQQFSMANPGMQQPGGGGMQERGPEGPPIPPQGGGAGQLAQGGGQPPMVRVQAPDGEIRMLSSQDAQRAQALHPGVRILG